MGVLHFLMHNLIANATIEYNDNRISLYVAQKGVCAITKGLLTLEQIHRHHKTPVPLGGGLGVGESLSDHAGPEEAL